jgi:hypothetical protein
MIPDCHLLEISHYNKFLIYVNHLSIYSLTQSQQYHLRYVLLLFYNIQVLLHLVIKPVFEIHHNMYNYLYDLLPLQSCPLSNRIAIDMRLLIMVNLNFFGFVLLLQGSHSYISLNSLINCKHKQLNPIIIFFIKFI